MPGYFEQGDRYQDATLWEWIADNPYGEPIVDPAVDLKVRWEETRRDAQAPDGSPILIEADVMVGAADIPLGSIMRQGTVASLPSPPTGLMVVVGRSVTPSLMNVSGQTRRTLHLSRFPVSLPTVGTGT